MSESFGVRAPQSLVIRDINTESRLSLRAALAVWTIGSGVGWGLIAWLIRAAA